MYFKIDRDQSTFLSANLPLDGLEASPLASTVMQSSIKLYLGKSLEVVRYIVMVLKDII